MAQRGRPRGTDAPAAAAPREGSAAAAQSAPVVPGKARYNFSDPESGILLASSKAFEQCYNAQAAVDRSSQIILAADLTNQASAWATSLPVSTTVCGL